jgi:restriction system protein
MLRRLAATSTSLPIGSVGPGTTGTPGSVTPSLIDIPTQPEEALDAAILQLEAYLKRDLLAKLRDMDPSGFERLILDLLIRLGYGVTSIPMGGAGDEGLDGVLHQDRFGLERVYIQAKRYKADNLIGPGKVREFVGALTDAGAVKGVFATTSAFTAAAKDALPKGNHTARIVLIDGEELARLMIEHEVGVRTVQTIRIRRLDLQVFEDEDAA